MLAAGARIGPYEIVEPLRLAIGEVYRARDEERGRDVAIQLFRLDFAADPDRLRRFEAEVHRAATLAHPHILQMYDAGTDRHAVYIVWEPIEGRTLRAALDARNLSLAAATGVAIQTARALLAARRAGVRHGHLHADAVVIGANGHVTVAGFGQAALQPARRLASDAAAFAALVSAMLRARPRAGRMRRYAWTAGLGAAVAAIVMALWPVERPARIDEPVPPPAEDRTALPSPPAPAEPVVPPSEPPETPPAAPAADARLEPRESGPAPSPSRSATAPAPPARETPPPPRTAPALGDAARPSPPPPVVASPRPPVVADGRDAASLITEATVRATEFDLAGASALLKAAASRGDVAAQVASLYIGGLFEAREAFREGGGPDALASVRSAIASLEDLATGRPGSAEIARLTLHAASAAAQSERDEMSLYLETALEMESLQRIAGLPGAPLVAAAEVAGELWLQVHRYEDARRAYTAGAERVGSTLRILSGLARTARRLNDTAGACASYRRLLDAWGERPGLPLEIAEARAYIGGCAR